MKVSFIKYNKEQKYKIPKMLGINIEEIINPEEVDNKIKELKEKQYTTVLISSELASFSDKIIINYKYDNDIKIVILP